MCSWSKSLERNMVLIGQGMLENEMLKEMKEMDRNELNGCELTNVNEMNKMNNYTQF